MTGPRLVLLGRFRVLTGGVEVPAASFGGRKVRALLRMLAVRAPDLVGHDALAEALWSGRPPADPVANLTVLVTRARRAVGDPGLVVTGPGGYALGPCAVDAVEFLAAVDAARRAAAAGDPPAALAAATGALALWGEPLPEDADAPWAWPLRERLRRARVEALEAAARAALALGDAASAAGHAAEAVAAEPLREGATVVLGRALAAAGDRAGALARLAVLRRALAEDLGVDPSAEVEQLQAELLRGGPVRTPAGPAESPARPTPGPQGSPGIPVAGPPPGPGPGAAVRAAAWADPGAAPVPGPPPNPWPGHEVRFAGRAAECARMRRVVGRRGIVAVAGVAGVGKSRLLAEALRTVEMPVVGARAFRPERAEAWGLARSLLRAALVVAPGAADALPARARDALAALLPGLGDDPGTAWDGESRRALVLAGGLRVLEIAAGAGAVLVVDDLQWADPSSLALVGSALARLPDLAAVLAHRSDEPRPPLLDELRDTRAVDEVALGPLPAAAIAELAGDPALADALGTATDRTPFAIAEVLRELVERAEVVPDGDGWRPRGAGAVTLAAELGREGRRRAIRRRALRHPDGAEVLALLALLAREVPAALVAAAADRDARATLALLSGLAAAGLARLGPGGWAVAHDLVGETVVAGLPDAERGRLHALLARALDAADADPSEVARHHREAGDTAAAAAAYARAARRALDGHATREAGALAERGLALAPAPQVRAALLDVRADARAAHGDLPAALADLRAALAVEQAAHRLARLAMLTSGARDPRRAGELAELAVVAAGRDPARRAAALETAAILDMNLGRPDRADERAEAALELYRGLGDARGVARVLDGRAMGTFLDGRVTAAVGLFARAADLLVDSGELLRAVTPRSTLGHALVFAGEPAAGLAETDTALRLAEELDAPEGRAYALWHRSEALSALGRTDEALAAADAALAVAQAMGHRGWTATAHRARGIALESRGTLDGAAAAFAASAAAAGEDLGLFAAWAAARGALVAVAAGHLDEAAPLVERALALGPPLGRHEARLAAARLALARGAPDAGALVADALAAARADGHAVCAALLAPDAAPEPSVPGR